jgi:hypothetical protein
MRGGMQDEQRQHERYAAKKGTLAVFLPRIKDQDLFIGQVLDISRGGLSLQYSAKRGHALVPSYVEIFGYFPHFIHIRAPARIVYVFPVRGPNGSCKYPRRCGVEFGELTEMENSNLDYFIKNEVVKNEVRGMA